MSDVPPAPDTLLKLVAPAGSTCHCTVGAGLPEAAAVKLTGDPAATVCDDGWVVTAGAVVEGGGEGGGGGALTVNVAGLDVAEPTELVNTAWYLLPLSEAVGVKVYVSDVPPVPDTLLNVDPPAGSTCHWTVGAGLPVAAAVKLTWLPAVAVCDDGWVVTAGA